MTAQLELLLERDQNEWRLDARTREVGRRGIAEARRILAEVAGGQGERPSEHAPRKSAA
jgi:hypothetical protein